MIGKSASVVSIGLDIIPRLTKSLTIDYKISDPKEYSKGDKGSP
jgi:hypothetical protein